MYMKTRLKNFTRHAYAAAIVGARVTGVKNTVSAGAFVVVDAFDVRH